MKHIPTFDHFLKNTVNLNKTRVDVAEKSIETMTKFLKNNGVFGPKFKETSAQGSFRQGTIIKPADPEIDFDVDILFLMAADDEWTAKDYLIKLADEFKKSDRYKDKVDTRGKNRCVTIDYESDFHVDIVPTIERNGGLVIMNKSTDEYETTDGEGYAKWFEKRNGVTGKEFLTKVVRVIKYLRDVKEEFDVKSILLTTLLGSEVYDDDDSEISYPDLPTSLKTIVNRLNIFLQANVEMPEVCNPALPEENFNRNWDQEKYDVFREKIKWNSDKIDEAYAEEEEGKSLELWQEVFGEDFALPAEEEKTEAKSQLEFDLDSYDHRRPITEIATGGELLGYQVSIEATVYTTFAGRKAKLMSLESNAKIKAGYNIKYEAHTNVRKPFEVFWQVVNTGGHAASVDGLRGEFFKGKDAGWKSTGESLINWESTSYTGKHWIECFIVKNSLCIARSGPFYINVENSKFSWRRRR